MKKGELLSVFVAVAVIAGIAFAVFRKKDRFSVYDDKGNLVDTQIA